MFQRTFLRQAQAARSALSVRSISTAPLRRTSPSQIQPQLRTFSPFARQQAFRSYSSENKSENGETAANKEGESEEAQDPVRKELEEKKKEVVDLKVRGPEEPISGLA